MYFRHVITCVQCLDTIATLIQKTLSGYAGHRYNYIHETVSNMFSGKSEINKRERNVQDDTLF